MNNHRTTCDPERIELFLEQKLSDEEQSAFESHLSACGNCRQRLETAAASEDISFEICESLREEQLPPGGRPSDDPDLTGEETFSSQATILKLLAPTDDDRMIGRWGTYEVVGVVGTGGMGVVLKAFDAALNRYVAIKILAPHLGSSGAAIRRFSREGKAAAAVVHDNVIEIYGVAEAAGLPYLVMPYVRGPSLQRRLDDEGPLAVVEILRVGMQAAAGLAAAHAQGLVHRDVKPANILLADGIERVKLTDFGLARAADDASLTRTGVIAGTPQYMSPEQARGEPVDPRSDLFSLGSVLYAMCTGRPPFRAETSYGVLRRITDEEPRPIREINPDIPEWLCGIVVKLMAKRPEDRFQSAHEVAALLEQCLAHVQQPNVVSLPTGVSLPSVGARKPRPFAGWSGRKRILFAMIGLLVFGGPALGIIIHLKKDGKTTTVEVPDGSTAHIDAHGAVTVELPPSPGPAMKTANEPAKIATFRTATEPLDVLCICATGTPRDQPMDGYYGVEPDGNVALGPDYGRVQVRGLTVEAAGKAIEKKLQGVLKAPKVQVTFGMLDPPWHEAAPPRQPYTIAPLDVLEINVPGAPQDQPIDGAFLVEPDDGTVSFGPVYGRVQLKGLTLEEAQRAIEKKLQAVLKDPKAWVTLPVRRVRLAPAPRAPYTIKPNDLLFIMTAGVPADQPIYDGVIAVEPGGTLALGPLYGRVNVKGLSLEATEKAVEKKLRDFLTNPMVSVTIAGWADPAGALRPGPIEDGVPLDARRAKKVEKGARNVPGTVSESESSTPIHRFAPGFPVNTIAFSPDGKLIAAANDQQTVKLIDVTTGKTYASLQIAANEEAALLAYPAGAAAVQVSILAFSPDGNTLAVGTNTGQVKLFDVQSGKLLRSLDDRKARLAEKETPDKSTPIKRAMGSIESLAFSPDGKTLATSGNSFRDYADDAKLGRGSVRRSPGPGRLKLWDVRTGTVKEDLVAMVFPFGVAFSPDGHWLAQAGGWFVSNENWGNGAVLWNLEGSKPAARFVKAIQHGGIYAVAFSPDSKLLAIGTNDELHGKDGEPWVGGRVSLFHIAKGVMEWSATVPTPAKRVAFARDGKCVVVLCDRQSIRFLESEGGTLKREIRPAGFAQWAPFAIALNADLLAAGGIDANRNGLVEIWDCKESPAKILRGSAPAATQPRSVYSVGPRAEKATNEPAPPATEAERAKQGVGPGPGISSPPREPVVPRANATGKATTFQPLDCVLVDEKTGEPVPGNDFAISLRYVIPRKKDRPWQLVDEIFLGPNHPGTFQFTVPDKVLRHPDRDLIFVEWMIVHPRLDANDEHDPIRVNEILNDDPRTARQSIRRIKMHDPRVSKGQRPEHFDAFTARVYILQGSSSSNILQVGRDEVIAAYERVLKRFPDHPDRATAMFEIFAAWENGGLDTDSKPDPAKALEWLRKACAAARPGTPLWYKSRFYLEGRVRWQSADAAQKILDEILASHPGAVNEVRAWYDKQEVALMQNKPGEAEKICRRLQRVMGQQKLPVEGAELGEYFDWIQESAGRMLNYWDEHPSPENKAKIDALRNDFHYQHIEQWSSRSSR
jgi:serine/threonine protein kinase/protein involved in polysaccharide export with SLBB domain/WD40 repeat protein